MKKKKQNSPVLRDVPAVSRAISILRLLGRSQVPLGLQAIAKPLGLVPSTCLHILRILVAEQLVSVDPATKQYALSVGTVALARIALQKQSFGQEVQRHLDQLSDAYGVTAIAVQAVGIDHMIVVALSRSSAALRIHVDIGSRFPLLISATGRCVAAFGKYPWRELAKRFQALRWNNPPTLEEWRAEIDRTRTAGFAVDDGRYIAGVTILAAPVYMPGGIINSIVVVGVTERLKQIGLAALGAELRSRAEHLSTQLS